MTSEGSEDPAEAVGGSPDEVFKPIPIPPEGDALLQTAFSSPDAVLVLPGVMSDEAEYAPDAMDLAKLLARSDVAVVWASPPDAREYLDLKAADLFLGTLAVATQVLASGGGQLLADGVEHMVGMAPYCRTRLRIAVVEQERDKTRWFQADGRGKDVVKALRVWKG